MDVMVGQMTHRDAGKVRRGQLGLGAGDRDKDEQDRAGSHQRQPNMLLRVRLQ